MGEEVLDSTLPKNKVVKFLCSHGGKILPRPTDGHLRYVGGETRVLAFPRSITFSGLNQKLRSLVDCDMILKYKMMPEDLDTLVSVKTDEDIVHMIEEYDRYGATSSKVGTSPAFRAFLFPTTPLVINPEGGSSSNGHLHRHCCCASTSPNASIHDDCTPTSTATPTIEQCYIDAINGIVRTSSPSSNGRPIFMISSPQSTTTDASPQHQTLHHHQCHSHSGEDQENKDVLNGRTQGMCHHLPSSYGQSPSPTGMQKNSSMQRVHSSPSLSTLERQQQQQLLSQQRSHQLPNYHHIQLQQQQQMMRIPPRMPSSPKFLPTGSADGLISNSRHYHRSVVGQHSKYVQGGGDGGYCMQGDGGRASYIKVG